MRFIRSIVLGLSALALLAAGASGDFNVSTTCQSEWITTSTTDVYIKSNSALDITLFNGGETLEVQLYTCAKNSAASCDVYYWDHNGNGTKDQSTLDGDGTAFTRGVRTPNTYYYRAEVTVSPSASNVASLMACPIAP